MPMDFNDIFIEDRTRTGTTTVIPIRSAIVNREDIEPFSIIAPDEECGPWIAGGACIHWFLGEHINGSDIDVFCKNYEQAQKVIDRIKSYNRYMIMATTDNAITFRYFSKDDEDKSWLIQVILCRFFDTLSEIIDSFDLSVCQIGTTGDHWELGKYTALDIKHKKLRFVNGIRNDSVKRLVKYWTYGYTPVEGTLEALQTDDNITWSFNSDENYSNAF